LILVSHDYPARPLDGLGDHLEIEWHDRAQIDDANTDPGFFRHLRSHERTLNDRTPRDDNHVVSRAPLGSPGERDHVVGTGVLRLVVSLAIEMLVLEEHDWIVAANGRAQQTRRIRGRGGKRDSQAWAVRKYALPGLTVVHPSTAQVAPDGNTNHDRRLERVR
jgi:hypothetical protein